MISKWVTHLTETSAEHAKQAEAQPHPAMSFPYELDDFQKHAVQSIENNEHVLVSVPTGAGKTSVCLYAIANALNKNQKVIYTSPIKSLSNQKFKEFKEKLEPTYGLGTVGILTGDIKFNPEARCLIMTTEILRNLLYKQGETSSSHELASTNNSASSSHELASTNNSASSGEASPAQPGVHMPTQRVRIDGSVNTPTTGVHTPTQRVRIDGSVNTPTQGVHTPTQRVRIDGSVNTPTQEAMLALDLNEIGCVVFDEVHYINDRNRGKVWEETIVMLPPRILLVMLSATIDKPEKFASWIGDLKEHRVNLITSSFRPVPLNHFVFAFDPDTRSDGSGAKDPKKTGSLVKLMNERNQYIDQGYDVAQKIYRERYLDPATGKPKRIKGHSSQQVNIQLNRMELSANCLNPFFKFLQAKNLLPALIFVLSRRNCEVYASNIHISLVTSAESGEINKIFNYHMHPYQKQYEKLQQFTSVKNLLLKGVGVHHSGLVPILKEIVEILFATGLIKVLFCTETFAVGVNMPTKTVVFTELEKYDGYYKKKRLLKTDEYLQMAGRAGRRGLDTLGTVIHFPLRDLPDRTELKGVMTGRTPEICSKFSLNYQFILKVIESENHNLLDFVNSSLLNREQERYLQSCEQKLENLIETNSSSTQSQFSKEIIKYHKIQELFNSGFTIKGKQLKKMRADQYKLSNGNNPKFLKEYEEFLARADDKKYHQELEEEIAYLKRKNLEDTRHILQFLQELGYINREVDLTSPSSLNKDIMKLKGLLAAQISECNEILLTELLTQGILDENLTLSELAGLLAIFIDERSGGNEPPHPNSLNVSKNLKDRIKTAIKIAEDLETREHDCGIDRILETDWTVATGFVQATYFWANEEELGKIYTVTDVYEGNFIRGILKVSHLAESLVTLAEVMQKPELSKLAETLSKSLIRDEVTVNSLYVR